MSHSRTESPELNLHGGGATPVRAERRVFLLSSPRAGSTLLSRVLDSHTKIASPCEICIPYIVTSSWKFLKSLKNIAKISEFYGARMPAVSCTLAFERVARWHLDGLVEAILQKDNKQTVVIKDPRHAAHVEKVDRLCADDLPKYILLHRDARAVCHSFTSTLGRKPQRGFKAWLQCTQGMLACEHDNRDRCLSLRFEDFVANPAHEARRIVEFLGHTFEDTMLDYGQHQHADDQLGLWTNSKLVDSVKRGLIAPPKAPSWLGNDEILEMYDRWPLVQSINEKLGYPPAAGELAPAA